MPIEITLADCGINWILYTPALIDHGNRTIQFTGDSYRLHKDDMSKHPACLFYLTYKCDEKGRSGVNIKKFKKTGVKELYPKTHVDILEHGVNETIRYKIIKED